ncbi:MAG: nuclear transport factor 2 family protein [Acidobacteria bacterium]|nr:nuclear transport factor 2 family protein [Acidobacteriota bacterium]
MLRTLNHEEQTALLKNNTEYELIRFMSDWGHLSGRRDTTALELMLPDDLVVTTAEGAVFDKERYLDNFRTIAEDFTIVNYDQQAQLFGAAAVVRARYLLTAGGRESRLCYTATFVRRFERWEIVALHSSPVANA